MIGMKKLIIVSALLLAPHLSWAAHPLITDDAETQGDGKFQVEVNGQYDYDKETAAEGTVKTTGGEAASIVSYGMIDTVDLVFVMPYQWNTVKEDGVTVSDEQGVSDMTVEVKWLFFEKEGLRLAFKPGISIPAGNEKKGLGSGKTGYGAFLIASVETNPWQFHVNVGYRRHENTVDIDERRDIWHASAAATCEVIQNMKAVGNIGIERNADKSSDSNPTFILGGIIYSIGDNFDLDFGVKRGLNEAETDYSLLAGTTFRF